VKKACGKPGSIRQGKPHSDRWQKGGPPALSWMGHAEKTVARAVERPRLITFRSRCYELRRVCRGEELRKRSFANRRKVKSPSEQSGPLDAHRGDAKRFVVRADEKLTAFIELESTVRNAIRLM